MKKALMLVAIGFFVSVVFVSLPRGAIRAYYTQDLVTNGGFEADPLGTGWSQSGLLIGAWTGIGWHGGIRGALLGGKNNAVDILSQAKLIPANATSATLTYWYQWGTSETNMSYCYDYAKVEVLNLFDPTEIASSSTLCSNGVTNWGTWSRVDVDVTSLKGKTAYFRFIVSTDVSLDSGLIIDDVNLVIEKPDMTAPTTSLSVSPNSPNGSNSYYTTIPTITLSVSDDVGGSGVDKPFYAWDSGALVPYAGPFAALEGTHTLSYISSDVAGNAEVVKKAVIKVDTGVPATMASVSLAPNPASGWYGGAPTVTLASTDGTSGIGGIYYNWDGAAMTPYSAIITVPSGAHTLNYYAVDGAGNAEPVKTLTLKLDSSGPTITLDKPDTSVMTNSSAYTITGKVSDTVSGLAGLSINGISTPVNPDGSFSQNVPVKLGANVVTLSATDTAGNNSVVTQTVTYKHPAVLGISTSKPTVTNKKPVKGSFDIKVGTLIVSVTPFGKGFSGKIWAQKINFVDASKSIYVFIPAGWYAKGAIYVYDAKAKLIRTIKPFGNFEPNGFKVALTVSAFDDKVYLVVTQIKNGHEAKVYQISSGHFDLITTLGVAKSDVRGTSVVRFVPIYSDQIGIATAIGGNGKTLKLWKYDPLKNKFIQDKKTSTKKIKVTQDNINYSR